MIEPISLTAGPQATDAAGSCCGGSSCGTTGASSTGSEAPRGEIEAAARTTAYAVEGMTCGHCVSAVRGELLQVPGVSNVEVDLVAGSVSTMTVTAQGALPEALVRDAVEEAGYRLLDTGSPS